MRFGEGSSGGEYLKHAEGAMDSDHVDQLVKRTDDAERSVRWRMEVERALAKVAGHLDLDADFDRAMNMALQEVGVLVRADRSYLFIVRDGAGVMANTHEWCAPGVSAQKEQLQDLPVSMVPWWMDKLRKGEVVNVPDVLKLGDEAKAEREILQAQEIRSVIALPVFVFDKLVGFVGFDNVRTTAAFGADELSVLQLLSKIVGSSVARRDYRCALLVDAARRHEAEKEVAGTLERLRRSLRGTIDAIARVVETRDPYTAGHQRRVANLARAIAQDLWLPEEVVDGVRMAGVIHDIGKISVPSEILSKPGRLTAVEFELIKAHPGVGYEILKDIEFPRPVADIVMQHHERMDGSGYPAGLQGGNILVEARIVAVADVVEAMASHRPYRAALGENAALDEIERHRDSRYDPDVVDACVRLFRAKGFRL